MFKQTSETNICLRPTYTCRLYSLQLMLVIVCSCRLELSPRSLYIWIESKYICSRILDLYMRYRYPFEQRESTYSTDQKGAAALYKVTNRVICTINNQRNSVRNFVCSAYFYSQTAYTIQYYRFFADFGLPPKKCKELSIITVTLHWRTSGQL